MGLSPTAGKPFQALGADANDFFPHGVRVGVGDKVRFVPYGFHSVNFPATGKAPDALVAPNGQKVSGVNDAAGTPFWFNGQDSLSFSRALLAPKYGKTLSYNGSKGVQSGLPLAPKPKPMTVKFTKAGKYTYYCTVHPGMKGTVTVRAAGKGANAKKTAKALTAQIKRDLKIAKGLTKTVVPAGTVDVGAAGPHGVEYFGMLPAKVTVAPGSTVQFRMSPGSYEDHTATFGPGNPETQPTSYLGAIAASFQAPVIDPRGAYPSEAPATTATLTPALHGNGFWNSGLLDTAQATPPPAFNSVKFGTPGTYDYYCLIHPFMHGQVVVQ
jgi:plastocyanin